MTNEQKMIEELVKENENLLNKIHMLQAYNKELIRKSENLSTSFIQLIDKWENLRNRLDLPQTETIRQRYELIEKSGIL
jgi:phage shock protein A